MFKEIRRKFIDFFMIITYLKSGISRVTCEGKIVGIFYVSKSTKTQYFPIKIPYLYSRITIFKASWNLIVKEFRSG